MFDSNRNRVDPEPLNTSDLFMMNTDGTEQTLLIRGSSATWSPDSKYVAFHASASGTEPPVRSEPGAATRDSDIFTANVDDLLEGVEGRRNITNDPSTIDDDPNWSPDGQQIVFVSRDVNDPNHNNPLSAEIYVMHADGTGTPTRLTHNREEERGPDWSPDGSRFVFACRRGPLAPGGAPTFEICVMDADGSDVAQLTSNNVPDLTPTWSPDGSQIVFHRTLSPGVSQFFVMNADGTATTQVTGEPGQGVNVLADWGELRLKTDG